jgi:biopolymer transport protein ExbD
MRIELPRRPRRRLITLTPLIDVVFILLLFFMLASRLTQLHAIPLDAPAGDQDAAEHTRALLLRIHADGRLDLNGAPIREEALEPVLAAKLERAPALRVLVQPQDQVPLQTTLRIFDGLAAAGVPILRLQ